jgi:hypothetical protein
LQSSKRERKEDDTPTLSRKAFGTNDTNSSIAFSNGSRIDMTQELTFDDNFGTETNNLVLKKQS